MFSISHYFTVPYSDESLLFLFHVYFLSVLSLSAESIMSVGKSCDGFFFLKEGDLLVVGTSAALSPFNFCHFRSNSVCNIACKTISLLLKIYQYIC